MSSLSASPIGAAAFTRSWTPSPNASTQGSFEGSQTSKPTRTFKSWSTNTTRTGRASVTSSFVAPQRFLPLGSERDDAIRLLVAKYTQYETMNLDGQPVIKMVVESVVGWGRSLDEV